MTTRSCLLQAAFLCALTSVMSACAPDELERGRRVFLEISEPTCAICHRLSDAGAAGEVGPDLDALKPSRERVKEAVTNGIGVMPAFESLTPEQIDAVSHYVSAVAGQKK